MLTLAQAKAEFNTLTASGNYTLQQLQDLAKQVTLEDAPGKTQGSVTVLYSGRIDGGLKGAHGAPYDPADNHG